MEVFFVGMVFCQKAEEETPRAAGSLQAWVSAQA